MIADSQFAITGVCPNPVTNLGAIYTGSAGQSPLYYWVIPRFPAGSGVPAAVSVGLTVGASNLSVSNYVVLRWSAAASATGYDVVRSSTPFFPTAGASSAVVLNTSSLTVTDDGSALSVYPDPAVASVEQGIITLTLDNQSGTAPFISGFVQNGETVLSRVRVPTVASTVSAGSVLQLGPNATLIASGGSSGAQYTGIGQGAGTPTTTLDVKAAASDVTQVKIEGTAAQSTTPVIAVTGAPTQTTVGAAGAGSALPATPTAYLRVSINGTVFVVPYYAAA